MLQRKQTWVICDNDSGLTPQNRCRYDLKRNWDCALKNLAVREEGDGQQWVRDEGSPASTRIRVSIMGMGAEEGRGHPFTNSKRPGLGTQSSPPSV